MGNYLTWRSHKRCIDKQLGVFEGHFVLLEIMCKICLDRNTLLTDGGPVGIIAVLVLISNVTAE